MHFLLLQNFIQQHIIKRVQQHLHSPAICVPSINPVFEHVTEERATRAQSACQRVIQ